MCKENINQIKLSQKCLRVVNGTEGRETGKGDIETLSLDP